MIKTRYTNTAEWYNERHLLASFCMLIILFVNSLIETNSAIAFYSKNYYHELFYSFYHFLSFVYKLSSMLPSAIKEKNSSPKALKVFYDR